MIESIILTFPKEKPITLSFDLQENKLVIDTSFLKETTFQSFNLVITFKHSISEFRNHDYTWVKLNEDRISSEFSPKIIKLNNGFFIQPNVNKGFWETKKNNSKILIWSFNPLHSHPLTQYSGEQNERIISNANQSFTFNHNLELLFSSKQAVEFSRSIIPFSAIACFTDHCDFDTLEGLQLQRKFFKENNIKVTKGFFLNHFSKRENNASMQEHSDEFEKWISDRHELAYHSLSQSLKKKEESLNDFFNFIPPFHFINTWIDHGYQPYNFSLYKNNEINELNFSDNLKKKNITILWNYIDSGTSTLGVINQLNSKDFTLQSFYKGIKNSNFKTRISLLIKNILFHYYSDEKMILKYKRLSGNFKKIATKKKLTFVFEFISNVFSLIMPLSKILIFWNFYKNKPYKLAKYTPLFFKHKIAQNEFYVFQTIEMVDFKKSLHPENINKLKREKGIFISHTYFSVPMEYHQGRMFKNLKNIDETVKENFKNLSNSIENKEIWNPTLIELIKYLANFDNVILDCDENENIVVKESANLIYRVVT